MLCPPPPPCPLHDLHARPVRSHRVCMGRRCPTLLVPPPPRCAGGGRGGWGSLLPGACGADPSGAGASAPASRAVRGLLWGQRRGG